MTTPDEMERAVERLRHRVDLESDNPYVVSAWSADDVLTRIVPHDDLVEIAGDLRLLLSERAELLAAVERMRGALERIAKTPLHNDGGAGRRIGQAVTEARAALTTAKATSTEQGERG